MQKFKIIYLLFLCVFMMGIASPADAVDLTLGASSTTVPPGKTFELQVNVSDASTLCGAAATVVYDATKVELVTTATTPALIPEGNVDPAEITSAIFSLVTDSRTPPGTPAQAVPMAGNHQTAKVSLSGAYVDPTTGAGKYAGSQKLFGLKFKVKDTVANGETISFNLTQTSIYNPAAGWGDANDSNKTPVAVPALVGVPADWKTKPVNEQFVNIPATFPTSPFVVTVGDTIAKGDVNGDGNINATDAYNIILVFTGKKDKNTLAGNCDVDGNGQINATDAYKIILFFTGKISSL